MIKAIADKAWLGITGGICLFLSAIFVGELVKVYIPRDVTGAAETITATIAILSPFLLLLLSALVFVRGCAMYSKARGYPPMLGVLLGLVPFVACIVLSIMSYYRKTAGATGFPVVPHSWQNSATHSNPDR